MCLDLFLGNRVPVAICEGDEWLSSLLLLLLLLEFFRALVTIQDDTVLSYGTVRKGRVRYLAAQHCIAQWEVDLFPAVCLGHASAVGGA